MPVCRVRVEHEAEDKSLREQRSTLKTLVKLILNQTPLNCQALNRILIKKNQIANVNLRFWRLVRSPHLLGVKAMEFTPVLWEGTFM